jgi:DNA-binding beta-propeller fold protein YncE
MKKFTVIFLLIVSFLFSCKEEIPKTIQTIAGSGNAGFKDGKIAELNKPIRFAPYKDNSIIFADINNHAIRIVNLEGEVSTIAGGPEKKGYQDGTADEAKFQSPHGVAYDKENDIIYVAEASNHTIRKIIKNENGDFYVSTVAGVAGKVGFKDGAADSALFISPHAVGVGKDGGIYVADIGNTSIRKVKDGVVSTVTGNKQGITEHSEFKYLMDFVVDGEIIYMADAGNHSIYKIEPEKEVSSVALKDTLSTPHGIAIDKDKNLYIADMGTHRILKIDSKGNVTAIAGTGKAGSKTEELNKPAAVLFHNDYLWIADLENHQIKALYIN